MDLFIKSLKVFLAKNDNFVDKIGDITERDETLKKMEKCGNNSVPILRTLYNFYLQFGISDFTDLKVLANIGIDAVQY